MICNFDRSSILAPNDSEDIETFLDLAPNGNKIWLPFKYFDIDDFEMGYWKNYKSDQWATFLHFAPRNPDPRHGKLLQINQVKIFLTMQNITNTTMLSISQSTENII